MTALAHFYGRALSTTKDSYFSHLTRFSAAAIIIIAEAAFDFTAWPADAGVSARRGFQSRVNYATLFGARRC